MEEKEELKEQDVQSPEVENKEEEDVDKYFNPFTDISDEDKEIEKEIKEEEGDDEEKEKEEKVVVAEDVRNELAEVKAERLATREVNTFVKDHPEFVDMTDELIELASKASVRGHSKPLEFAVRNVKSPSYWIELGKEMGREDLHEVSQNRIGGASLSKGENKGVTDYMGASKEDFESLVSSVKNNT